jgi:hypothetical protein
MSGLLTPQFFDALVIGVVIAGLILAAVRLMNDFKRGPRWPEQAVNRADAPVPSPDLEETTR